MPEPVVKIRLIDTSGDQPLAVTFVAVVVVEAVVLTGLWLFSRYFSS